MNLTYAADGEALQHALVAGDASIQIAGEAGKPARQIVATTIDIALAPDGTTPTALLGPRERAAHVSAGTGRSWTDHPRREPRRQRRAEARADARHVHRRRAASRARGRRRIAPCNSGTLDVGLEAGHERDRRREVRAGGEVRGRQDGGAGGRGSLRHRQGHARTERQGAGHAARRTSSTSRSRSDAVDDRRDAGAVRSSRRRATCAAR